MSDYEIAVIGRGIAGLNAAVTAARYGRHTVLIDRLGAGGQILSVDGIENYPGPAEGMAGYDLGPALQGLAEEVGVDCALGLVERLTRRDTGFALTGEGVALTADAVIVATGSARRRLGLPGEIELAGRGVSQCASCDGPLMKG